MKVLITILIIVAILAIAGLIVMSMKRKKDQQNRLRADELRSQAASTAHEHDQAAARAREAEAEAERARAQAEQADQRAQEQRLAHEQTRAQHEHHLREADRLDPDVDTSTDDYQPRLDEHGSTRGTTEGTDGSTHEPSRAAIPNEGRGAMRPPETSATDPSGRVADDAAARDGEPRTWSERTDADEPGGRHQA